MYLTDILSLWKTKPNEAQYDRMEGKKEDILGKGGQKYQKERKEGIGGVRDQK